MLERAVRVLYLVGDRTEMLTDEGLLVLAVGLVLAAAAGLFQLFSP